MRPLPYTATAIDRAEHLRAKDADINTLLHRADARFLPVWNELHPVNADGLPSSFGPEVLHRIDLETSTPIFLGLDADTPVFALDLAGRQTPPDLGTSETFVSLRAFGALVPEDQGALFAYARALAIWHRNHPHCARCGAHTRATDAGHSRTCTAVACAHRTFPRTDPAVIVLISHGDMCLLGRQAQWAPGLYSTIAGFVEAGETIENAVRREVAEETGVRVGVVRYLASQPWPFPSSLMLGFRGEALSTEIVCDIQELEDCRWFSRDQVRAADAEKAELLLPHRSSISRWLIETWCDET